MDFKARYKFDVNNDLIGKGEFSRVYRAKDTLLERVVALKFFTVNASEKHQVLDEIKKVISFEHPNLCKYFDVEVLTSQNVFGEEERIEIGIMEYLDKGDFKSFIATHPQFTDKLLIDVLNGLSYLHSRGIVHHDLKPQNILIKMVDNKPVAKITDFRNSKLIDGSSEDFGALPGTIEYIAPELFNPKKYGINGKVATNLDLWSFGLIVYEIINAEPLFGSRSAGESAEQIMANILNNNHGDKLEAAPPKYRNILSQCLVKEASKRTQNAADLIPLLEGAVQSRPHVFVTQQAAYPKIIDHNDTKTFSDPEAGAVKEPEIGPAISKKVTELPVTDDYAFPDQQEDQILPRAREWEDLEHTKALTQAASSDVNVNPPITAAENRRPDEAGTNPQHNDRNDARQHSGLNRLEPASAKKKARSLSTESPSAAKPVNIPERGPRTPYLKKPVNTTASNKEEKQKPSWKSGVIGLVLAAVFVFLLFLRPDEDPAPDQTRKKPASVQAQPPDAVLPKMEDIVGGVFLMGFDGNGATDAEKPVHPVLVSDFSMGKYEVTIGEFRSFIAATGYQTTAEQEGSTFIYNNGGNSRKAAVNWRFDINGNRVDSAQANLPVVHVSWHDAVAYCNWLSEKTGKKYRLPTEAEWEYATLGGKNVHTFNFNGANSLSDVSWNGENSERSYHEVGGKKPNALGLFDMIGNVYEWCADWYDERAYRSGKAENPSGPKSGSKKVIRGGSWYRDGGAEYYRPTIRFLLDPKDRGAKVGFRVCFSSGK